MSDTEDFFERLLSRPDITEIQVLERHSDWGASGWRERRFHSGQAGDATNCLSGGEYSEVLLRLPSCHALATELGDGASDDWVDEVFTVIPPTLAVGDERGLRFAWLLTRPASGNLEVSMLDRLERRLGGSCLPRLPVPGARSWHGTTTTRLLEGDGPVWAPGRLDAKLREIRPLRCGGLDGQADASGRLPGAAGAESGPEPDSPAARGSSVTPLTSQLFWRALPSSRARGHPRSARAAAGLVLDR